MKNTFAQGRVKILVYKEKEADIWYATALEFNLTIDGDDRSAVLIELQQAVADYVQSARELNDEPLLNQEPDPELLAMWERGITSNNQSIVSPYIPYFAGVETLV